jgi:AraC family transcriptional regulator
MALSPHLIRVLQYIDRQLAAEETMPAAAVVQQALEQQKHGQQKPGQQTQPNALLTETTDTRYSINRLSEVAHWSKFHFQRQFFNQCGLSVQSYLRLLRLLRAASQLSFRQHNLTDIAASSGYQHSESFSRAFRRLMQQTPAEFRSDPDWLLWQQQSEQLTKVRAMMQQQPPIVDVIDFPATDIALLMHRGSPALLGASIRQFIEFRKSQQLPPSRCATFNLLYDDPRLTDAADYRFGLAVAVNSSWLAQVQIDQYPHISLSQIPGGRCARVQHIGDDQQLAELVDYLYQSWLEQAGEQPADFPIFLQRKVFFPDVPAHLAQTDILMLLQ